MKEKGEKYYWRHKTHQRQKGVWSPYVILLGVDVMKLSVLSRQTKRVIETLILILITAKQRLLKAVAEWSTLQSWAHVKMGSSPASAMLSRSSLNTSCSYLKSGWGLGGSMSLHRVCRGKRNSPAPLNGWCRTLSPFRKACRSCGLLIKKQKRLCFYATNSQVF